MPTEKEFQEQRRSDMKDLREILELSAGRRFLWRLLERAGAFRSIWEQSARIHYNAGQQDFGHFIMGEITEANEELLFQMMRENKEKVEEMKS